MKQLMNIPTEFWLRFVNVDDDDEGERDDDDDNYDYGDDRPSSVPPAESHGRLIDVVDSYNTCHLTAQQADAVTCQIELIGWATD